MTKPNHFSPNPKDIHLFEGCVEPGGYRYDYYINELGVPYYLELKTGKKHEYLTSELFKHIVASYLSFKEVVGYHPIFPSRKQK